jgi:putative membrane protein
MIKRILVCFFGLLVVLQLLPSVAASSLLSTFVAALVLSLINVTLKPVMLILTLPINILTLGLFTLIVNAICIGLTDWLVPGFVIYGFGSAMLAALLLSIVTLIVNSVIKD